MGDFLITCGNNNLILHKEELEKKLSKIANLKDKSGGWVTKTLDVHESGPIKQIVWTLLTYLPSIRKYLYDIDLKQSYDILQQLKPQIQDKELESLFNDAVIKINTISKKYSIEKIMQENKKVELKKQEEEVKQEDTEKSEETTTSEIVQIQDKKLNETTYPSVKELMETFNQCWDENNQTFNDIPFDEKSFHNLLNDHFQLFKPQHTQDDYGSIGKKNMAEGDVIYVHADIHGDLKSLKKVIEGLQEKGLLDENFKCKPGVHLVFLGDYCDRGTHNLEVLQFLTTLQLENKEQVTLLRGNHEHPLSNVHYCEGDPKFKKFLFNKDKYNMKNILLLNRLYSTMLLSFYAGSYNKEKKRWEYVQFTHGMFELNISPAEMLNSEKSCDSMVVPKSLKEFNKRIVDLSNDETDYDQLIKKTKEKDLIKNYKQKQKWQESAKRIRKLWHLDLTFRIREHVDYNNTHLYDYITRYNWGDVSDSGQSVMGNPGERSWNLTPLDIKHYLRVSSTEESKVFHLFRGHEHLYENIVYEEKVKGKLQKKLVGTTLSISMFGKYAKQYFKPQFDTSYLLTIGPESHQWTKQTLLLNPDTGKMTTSQVRPIGSLETG